MAEKLLPVFYARQTFLHGIQPESLDAFVKATSCPECALVTTLSRSSGYGLVQTSRAQFSSKIPVKLEVAFTNRPDKKK